MRIDKVVEGGTWQELQRLLYAGFEMTTLACNVAVVHLLRNDSGLGPPVDGGGFYKAVWEGVRHARGKAAEAAAYCDRKKLPAPADCDLPSSVVALLSRGVAKHYDRHRRDMWAGRRGPPFFRYPAPYPQRAAEFESGVRMLPMACVPEGATDDQREARERSSLRPCVTLLFGSRDTKEAGGGEHRPRRRGRP